jgi:hypothetical protein
MNGAARKTLTRVTPSTVRPMSTDGSPRSQAGVRLPDNLASVVAAKLGYYVYVLVDPRDEAVFYVGKGQGSRFLAHETEAVHSTGKSAKTDRIRDILASGFRPRVDIVRHGLADESTALLVEGAVIDALSPGLTNAVAGHGDGRQPLDELKVLYAAPALSSDVSPAVMVRLSQWESAPHEIEPGYMRREHGWRNGMSLTELADSTRAWWKISPESARRRGAQHAVAVFEGVTRGVFKIGDWIEPREDGRRAFSATPVTAGDVYAAYVGIVGKRLPTTRGSQNPITYWPTTRDN